MRKLTLEETWKRCLSMWRWIVKQYKAHPRQSVHRLKTQWLDKHDSDISPLCDCYFCDWMHAHTGNWQRAPGIGGCPSCPGRKIDPEFHCMTPKHHYIHKPTMFLRELERLNRKRKVVKHG